MEITDASGYAGQADHVFTPRSEEEVAAILTRASSKGVPLTIMGALTGLAGETRREPRSYECPAPAITACRPASSGVRANGVALNAVLPAA